MIINLIIQVLINILGAIFYFLPIVSIEDIPLIGESVSNTLLTIIYTWNAVVETLPYLGTVSTVFFTIIIPFEILVILSKFFLGSRSPIKA